jgi:phosphoadenosine phosphosulfate reductase
MQTDSIIVSFSAGKDSLAVLDLCSKRFKKVFSYFMYQVQDMSFQQRVIRWAEKRYNIEIVQIPHFNLPRMLNRTGLHMRGNELTEVKATDCENLMRDHFGCEWLASGESKYDSLQRRGMLSVIGASSVALGVADEKRKRLYPICDWNRATVLVYLRRNKIPLPSIYSHMRSSFGRIRADELQVIHTHYPEDYAKLLKVFPFAEAVRVRGELYADTGMAETN